MVDLTPKNESIVTTQAPTSGVSPAQIAAPYAELGQALDKVAGGVDDVAVRLAHEQALKAVTRDDQGNLQVEPAPFMIGRAAVEYQRVAHQAYLAQIEPEIQNKVAQSVTQYEGKPQDFQAWGQSYVDELANKQPSAELQNAVRGMAGRYVGESANGLILRQGRRDLATAQDAISTQQTSIQNDLIALARGGMDEKNPEYQSRVADWVRLQGDRRANPAFGYGETQAAYDREQFLSTLAGNHFLHNVTTIANDTSTDDGGNPNGGIPAALKYADGVLTDQSLNLTPAQRQKFWVQANTELRALRVENRQARQDAREGAQSLLEQSAYGGSVDPDDVSRAADEMRKAGDVTGAARFLAGFVHKPLNDGFGTQPLADQVGQLNAIKGAAAAKQAYDFFIGKGYTKEQAAGIVGNLVHESGVNPTSSGDGGTSLGIAQFHRERLTALKQFAAARGTAPTEFKTQLEFIDNELHGTEAGTLAKLQGAKTPEDAAAAFIDYERPAGWAANNPAGGLGFQSRQRLARAAFDGEGHVIGGANPANIAWLSANRAHVLDKTAGNAWQTVMKDYTEKQIMPSDVAFNQIADSARAVGDYGLMQQMAADRDRMIALQVNSGKPLPAQAATITDLQSAGAAGQLAPGQAAVITDLQKRYNAIAKGLEENPIGTTVANFPDRFNTPAPLNVQDPQQLVAGLAQRAQIARFAAQNWETKTPSALDKADLNAVKAALDTPDPTVKARIFSAISNALPYDVRMATLSKLAEEGGPNMAVSAAAGALLSRDADVAMSILRGQTAVKADKEYWPTARAQQDSIAKVMNERLPAAAFSLGARSDPNGMFATAVGMVKARYADLSAQSSDTSGDLDQARLTRAIDDVTGGVLVHNGAPLIAPARGMRQAQFEGVLRSVTDKDLAGVTTLAGEPVTPEYLQWSAQLESIGDGRYAVRLGKNPLRPIYAYTNANTETPSKFVLDLRGRPFVAMEYDLSPMTLN